MTKRHVSWNWLTWLIPAAVLVISGVAKLLSPGGQMPTLLHDVMSASTFHTLLIGLAILELVVALGLVLPRWRPPARYAALALLILLSGFVALAASDAAFLDNCGCFGDLPLRKSTPSVPSHVSILAMNAFLCLLLASGNDGAGAMKWAQGGFVGVVVALTTLYAAERSIADGFRRQQDATQRALVLPSVGRWRFPDIALLDAEGERTSAHAALRPNDLLVFFHGRCGVCKQLGKAWAQMSAETDRRLVFVAIASDPTIPAFLASSGLDKLPHYTIVRPEDRLALGIVGVPDYVQLGENFDVEYHSAPIQAAGLGPALASLAAHTKDEGRAAWTGVAQSLLGPGVVAGAATRTDEAGVVVPLESAEGPMRLVVVHAGRPASRRLEIALVLDADDRITACVPLTVGGAHRLFAEELRPIKEVKGLSLDEALEKAHEQAALRETLDASIWFVLHQVLSRANTALAK